MILTPRRRATAMGVVISTVSVLALYAASQRPEPTRSSAAVDVEAARSAFEGYNQALIDRDYTGLHDRFVHAPFVVIDDVPRVVTDVDTVVGGLRKTRESLDTAGYATTKAVIDRVSVLTGTRLLLDVRLSHLRRDGSVLGERANIYLLVNESGVWKVAGVIPRGE